MKNNLHRIIIGLICLNTFCSCNTSKKISRDYPYFQKDLDSISQIQNKELTIESNDILTIQIFSGTVSQEQSTVFNLQTGGYEIDINGNIKIAVIDTVKALGLTRNQLASSIIKKVEPYLKNPNVVVKFQSCRVNMLGEVGRQGVITFPNDRFTIFDAITSAGGLSDQGKRDDVLLIREENGNRIVYDLDLRSGKIFNSPAFLLKQNDIVYVRPNKNKLKSLNAIDPEFQKNISLITTSISALSLVISFLYILRIVRY